MNHIELWQSETHVSKSERAWLKYIKAVEVKLGHDLDGDQDVDGYSIDTCHDFFCDGADVEQAVSEFRFLIAAAA